MINGLISHYDRYLLSVFICRKYREQLRLLRLKWLFLILNFIMLTLGLWFVMLLVHFICDPSELISPGVHALKCDIHSPFFGLLWFHINSRRRVLVITHVIILVRFLNLVQLLKFLEPHRVWLVLQFLF